MWWAIIGDMCIHRRYSDTFLHIIWILNILFSFIGYRKYVLTVSKILWIKWMMLWKWHLFRAAHRFEHKLINCVIVLIRLIHQNIDRKNLIEISCVVKHKEVFIQVENVNKHIRVQQSETINTATFTV